MQETRTSHWTATLVLLLGWVFVLPVTISQAEEHRFVRPEQAMTYIDPASKSELKVLIDQHLGGTTDLTLVHIVIPAGVDVPDHVHQSTEIFYILSGELEQTSEGKLQKLTPGMACLVPANTTTHHKVTSKEPVHALVIWTPGGEEKRVTEGWQVRQPTAK